MADLLPLLQTNILHPSTPNTTELDRRLSLLEDDLSLQQTLLDIPTSHSITRMGRVTQPLFAENAIFNKSGHDLWHA